MFLWFVELTAIAAAAVSIYAQNYAAMLFYGFVSVVLPLLAYRSANRPSSDSRIDGKTRDDAIRAFLVWDAVLAVVAMLWFTVSLNADGGPYLALALFCLALPRRDAHVDLRDVAPSAGRLRLRGIQALTGVVVRQGAVPGLRSRRVSTAAMRESRHVRPRSG
jgi:hypothetical protein